MFTIPLFGEEVSRLCEAIELGKDKSDEEWDICSFASGLWVNRLDVEVKNHIPVAMRYLGFIVIGSCIDSSLTSFSSLCHCWFSVTMLNMVPLTSTA